MPKELTREQLDLLKVYVAGYKDKIVNNQRYTPNSLTVADVKDDIAWIYSFLNKAPPKFIFFANSNAHEKLLFNFITNGGLSFILEYMDKSYLSQPEEGTSDSWPIFKDKTVQQAIIDEIKKKTESLLFPFTKISSLIERDQLDIGILAETAFDLIKQIKDNYPFKDDLPFLKDNPFLTMPISYSKVDDYLNVLVNKQMRDMLGLHTFQTVWDTIISEFETMIGFPIVYPIIANMIRETGNTVTVGRHMKTNLAKRNFSSIDRAISFYTAVKSARHIRPNQIYLSYISNVRGLPSNMNALYSYFLKAGIMQSEEYQQYFNFINKGVWSFLLYHDWCIITRMPLRIRLNINNRLHSLDTSVIEWRPWGSAAAQIKEESGSRIPYPFSGRQYFIHGIQLDEDLWDKTVQNKLTISEILAIKNMEQRQAVLSAINPEIFIKECGAKCISTHIQKKKGQQFMPENAFNKIEHEEIKLYQIDDVRKLGLRSSLYIMFYKDPSTRRQYYMFVHPNNAIDAATAMAASLGLDKKQYIELAAES